MHCIVQLTPCRLTTLFHSLLLLSSSLLFPNLSSIRSCNGIDDNCDGMIDNGLAQLDCPNGTVCWSGTCQPVQPLTKPQVLLPRSSPSWYFYGQGHLGETFPLWTNAT